MKVYKYLVALVVLASCDAYCPTVRNTGNCSYVMKCIGNIRPIKLHNRCLESTNDPVFVNVTLTEAIERFDEKIDPHFLGLITKLTIFAKWKETELSILEHMPKLQSFSIVNSGIENIGGTPFFCTNNLKYIDLSHNKLNDIREMFQFEAYPNRLKHLSLAYNAIQELPGDAFQELTSLTELDLSYNLISDLSEEPFSNLTVLETLRLNNNRIKDLNGAVNNLGILKHLYLRGNQIVNVDMESLKIIMDLETFDVSGNHLEQIKPDLFSRHWDQFGNHSVCKIILSENFITHVPNGTSKEISGRYVRHLTRNPVDIFTTIDLSRNSISNIEYNAFQSIVQLISLDLSGNKLIDFHVNPDDLSLVTYLNLSRNYIRTLYYESFSAMTGLEKLDLSYNSLDYIPDMTFNNNYKLQLVNMTYNEIEKLDRIHISIFHPNGSTLDLSHNGLYKLTIPLGEGLRLFTLLLSANNISDASLIDLTHQTDLKSLYMTKNLITELDHTSLHLPRTIVFLDLTCNRISKIGPSTFNRLGHLKTLRLGSNSMSEIDYGVFQGLISLENLDLSYNQIHYLDSKLLMDLKSLKVLSIRSNGMNVLDYKYWFGHPFYVNVNVDHNNFTCDWLAIALSDFHHGYSKMNLRVHVRSNSVHSLEGIPCEVANSQALTEAKLVMVDERLLITTQKILEAVKEQNYFLKKYMSIMENKKITTHNITVEDQAPGSWV